MSVHVSSFVWKLTDVSATEKLVLLAIADMTNHDGYCWPGRAKLAEMCCLTPRTVISATNSLVSKGYLAVEDRQEGRYGTNTYRIADPTRTRGEIASSLGMQGMKQTASRGESDDAQGVKEFHPNQVLNRQGTNARARARNPNGDTRARSRTADPAANRCLHDNNPADCWQCPRPKGTPPLSSLAAALKADKLTGGAA